MNSDTLEFYPKHPSNLKTLKIETTDMPLLKQDEPFDVKSLHQEFVDDLNGSLAIYEDKRFEVTGYAIKVGPDVHNKPSHYHDAEEAVRLLHSYGVPILVGTDSHDTFFLPKVCHGTSMHEEMDLLVKAGLSPLEVLQGATSKAIEAFGLSVDTDDKILIEGRPDKCITDIKKIKQIWIGGKKLNSFS